MITSLSLLVISLVIPRIQFTLVSPAAHWSLAFASLFLKSFTARLFTSQWDPVLYWALSLFQLRYRILHLAKFHTALCRQSCNLSYYVSKIALPSDTCSPHHPVWCHHQDPDELHALRKDELQQSKRKKLFKLWQWLVSEFLYSEVLLENFNISTCKYLSENVTVTGRMTTTG